MPAAPPVLPVPERGLRGLHPIFFAHHPLFLLVAVAIVVVVVLVARSHDR